MRSALITGLAGPEPTADEIRFLKEVRPAGLILFSRNCREHDEIRALLDRAREAVGSADLLVLIDQEGGRVQRLRPPLGRALPPAAAYARLYAKDAGAACRKARLTARILAEDLRDLGINADCAPVADVPVAGAHEVIGDRAYGDEPRSVATLARAVAEGLMAGGVLPIVKHIPGHGRATADSHLDLPVVATPRETLSATDFDAFKRLADLPAAMTAHVLFEAIDPDRPASTSLIVTRDVIRGEIGFDGLLMSDDLSMKALKSPIRDSAEAVIRAGSDLALHCNGNLSEMEAAAAGVPPLAGKSLSRFAAALEVLRSREAFSVSEAEKALASVLAAEAAGTESV